MRSWTGPSYMRGSEPRQAEAAEAAGERAHLLLGQVGRDARRVTDGSDHEVLQRLDVVRVDGLRVDVQLQQLAGAGHLRGDETAAGTALDLSVTELGLRSHELFLHLLC